VAFVSREYNSVEACEEKVYALLDQTITRATELSEQFVSADAKDPDLAELVRTIGTNEEDPASAELRGILLPYARKQSKIGTKRRGLYLLPTGLSRTKLGIARSEDTIPLNTTGSLLGSKAALAIASDETTPKQTARRAARKAAAEHKSKLRAAASQAKAKAQSTASKATTA
jgi:hypothetical protein